MRCSAKFAGDPCHTWLFYKLNYMFWVVIASLPCSKSNLQRKPQWSHANGRESNTLSVLGNLASSPTSWFLTSQKVAYKLDYWNNLGKKCDNCFLFLIPPCLWSSRNSRDRGWWELDWQSLEVCPRGYGRHSAAWSHLDVSQADLDVTQVGRYWDVTLWSLWIHYQIIHMNICC